MKKSKTELHGLVAWNAFLTFTLAVNFLTEYSQKLL